MPKVSSMAGRRAAACLPIFLWLLMAAPAQCRSVIDDDGRAFALAAAAPRIVSLAPGATAMLFAAGAGAQIAGTSGFSDEPEAAQRIERVGDSQNFDLERILFLHPDVVVVWGGGTSAAQIDKIERVGLPVYRHSIRHLAEIPDSLRRLGALAGTERQAQAAAQQYAEQIAALEQRYARTHTGSILIQVWDRPIYTVGRSELLSDVVRICGYRNIFDDLDAPGPAVSLESVLARDPELILAVGSDRANAGEWLDRWRNYPTLAAVRSGRLVPWTDPRLSRLGPSMVAATEALCRALSASRS
jgi:iron complex transport system substrate-binding protein